MTNSKSIDPKVPLIMYTLILTNPTEICKLEIEIIILDKPYRVQHKISLFISNFTCALYFLSKNTKIKK